ncbi:MAG: hypothetical protein IPK75_20165 [Acidobacteria bacterium]|nr:hypothetical protein [Acidobacteriota bacterium]
MPPSLFKTHDFMRHDGALILCRMIEDAWRAVGVTTVTAEPVLRSGQPYYEHYTITIHGLVNGAPA